VNGEPEEKSFLDDRIPGVDGLRGQDRQEEDESTFFHVVPRYSFRLGFLIMSGTMKFVKGCAALGRLG